MDKNRIHLLTLIDSPFVQADFSGVVDVAEAAEALYLLANGPEVLKPVLDGRRTEFTVAALHFYEWHARDSSLYDSAEQIMALINEALAPGQGEEGEPAADEDGRTNEEILASLDPEKVEQLQKKHVENLDRTRQGLPTLKEKPNG